MEGGILEVIVIGGGAAGMGAALTFGRALISTVIINEERPRNSITANLHNFLTRDGTTPLEFFQIAKQQLQKYDSVKYIKDAVINVSKIEAGFKVETQDGLSLISKKIIFATGSTDNLSSLNLKGVDKVYGKTVFACPLCDGWERKGKSLAVFGSTTHVVNFSKVISNWTNDLIIFTNGFKGIRKGDRKILLKKNIQLIEDEVEELISNEGQLQSVLLKNGKNFYRDGAFLLDTGEDTTSKLPLKLGITTYYDPDLNKEMFEASLFGNTHEDNVYIVGDAKDGYIGQFASAFQGSHCAKMIMYRIIDERWAI